jgi:hypothetical protein
VPFDSFSHAPYAAVWATLAWSIIVGTIAHTLVFKTPLFNVFIENRLPDVLVTCLNVMFVFFIAFMASDNYSRFNQAQDNVVKETIAVKRIMNAQDLPPEIQAKNTALIKLYLDKVVNQEWKTHLNKQASPQAEEALNFLIGNISAYRKQCVQANNFNCLDSLTFNHHRQYIDDLRDARDQRLAFGQQSAEFFRYALCNILGLNALIALMILFKANPKAARRPLIMYCFSFWMILLIVVVHTNPFTGFQAVKPKPLEQVLASLQ